MSSKPASLRTLISPQRRFDHPVRQRRRQLSLGEGADRRQRARIDADADGNAALFGLARDLLHSGVADVARIQAQSVEAATNSRERPAVVEVDVSDDGQRRRRTISGKTSAAALSGMAMRTMSQPASLSPSSCATVASTFSVIVEHIDCTAIGASPPICTSPTRSGLDVRRGSSFQQAVSVEDADHVEVGDHQSEQDHRGESG